MIIINYVFFMNGCVHLNLKHHVLQIHLNFTYYLKIRVQKLLGE